MEGSSQEVEDKKPVSDATQTAVIKRRCATQVRRARRLRLSSSRCSFLRRRLVRRRFRMGRAAGCREQQHENVCHRDSAGRRETGVRKTRSAPCGGDSPQGLIERSGGKRLYVDDCVGLCHKVGRL